MNFFLCNRCNKKSEDNILNFNSTEILLKNNRQNLINNNVIEKMDSIDQFPNINIGDNMHTSINNNINNLEEEKEDELEIIEYPYSKEKKIPNSKINPKNFKNNKSKFDSHNLIEKDILNQLNFNGNLNIPTKKNNVNNKKNHSKNYSKNQLVRKIPKININDDDIERKDTMTDPANIALSSLIQDINKKKNPNNNSNIEKNGQTKEEEEETIKDETENNYFMIQDDDDNNIINNNEKKIPDINKKNNKFIKTELEKKKINNQNRKNIKSYNNKNNNNKNLYIVNRITERKLSQNKKISEYNNSIIKKKNLLKSKGVFNNYSNKKNKNPGINPLSLSTKKQFPKSYSFNCFSNDKKINDTNYKRKGNNINNNELGYSLTLSKRYNNLFNHIFKNNDGISSPKKNEKNKKNNLKISHKKVSRAKISIQKAFSSHISSSH